MKEAWFKDCKTQEQVEKRERELKTYINAFEALKEKLATFEEQPTSDYASTAWALRMADINGANRMLRKVMSLITIKE